MGMSETWPDIYDEGYRHQLQPGPTKLVAAVEAPSLKIFSYGKSIKWQRRLFHENRHKLCDEKEHPFEVWRKVSGNWDNNMIGIWGKASVEQILRSEEINKSRRAGLWEIQSGIEIGKLNFWVRSFEIGKL